MKENHSRHTRSSRTFPGRACNHMGSAQLQPTVFVIEPAQAFAKR